MTSTPPMTGTVIDHEESARYIPVAVEELRRVEFLLPGDFREGVPAPGSKVAVFYAAKPWGMGFTAAPVASAEATAPHP